VVVDGDITAITGCTQSGVGVVPCTGFAVPVASGKSTKLTVGGKPVMLATVSHATNGNPPGLLTATTVQKKLSAV
jgi:hypothetical protein